MSGILHRKSSALYLLIPTPKLDDPDPSPVTVEDVAEIPKANIQASIYQMRVRLLQGSRGVAQTKS